MVDMNFVKLALALLLASWTDGFQIPTSVTNVRNNFLLHSDSSSTQETDTPTVAARDIDPKDAVKLFGRLAEKYIMLDASAGMCCYSACSDCEFRLPGGGYRMADQSAARPKWIPTYESRSANNKDHTSKWSSELFSEGPALKKEEFVEKTKNLAFAPPLGGPYVSASAATIEDTSAVETLFEVLADGKDVLTKHKMSVRLKQISGGEEGLMWPKFQKALE